MDHEEAVARALLRSEMLRLSGEAGDTIVPAIAEVVQFVAATERPVDFVVNSMSTILRVCDDLVANDNLSEVALRAQLPDWFLNAFRPEYTQQEALKERALRAEMSNEQRFEYLENTKWTLSSWAYWMDISRRQWYLCNIEPQDKYACRFYLEMIQWPTAWESFRWLFKACGGAQVYPAE